MRVTKALLAGTVLLAATAAVNGAPPKLPTGSPSQAGYTPTGVDEKGLWAEFEEQEREIKTSRLLIREPGINAYLRRVTCKIVGDEKCAAVRIYLVRVPEFNASMAPNGMMVVNSGLLLRVQSEAELAAVLGHEFAHFERRHGVQALRKARNAMSWGAWLSVASGLTTNPTNYVPLFLTSYFSFSRDQEREADLDGLNMLASSGYRSMSASTVWLHLREERDAQAAALGVKSLKDADYGPFMSHPMSVERMSYLAREGQQLTRKDEVEGQESYREAISPIWTMLIEDQIKLNDFGASEYILANLARGNWTGPLLYARAELYRARRKGTDLLTAETLYRQAIVREDAPPGSWRGLGLVLDRLGRRDESKAMLRDYLGRQPDAPDRAMLSALVDGKL